MTQREQFKAWLKQFEQDNGCVPILSESYYQGYADGQAAQEQATAEPVCTCPSGDGSLRWPCPTHPPQAAVKESLTTAEPIAYLAWRDGKPCYEGDDAVCEDAVWPVDCDDDRTSMPVYTHPAPDHTALLTEISRLDVLLEECKMDWSGDVAQIKAEHKHEIEKLTALLLKCEELLGEATSYTSSPSWSPSITEELNAMICAIRKVLP